jgi:four helix bundle protein
MRPFEELRVWQASYELTLGVYSITREFPSIEVYGLVSQMRRSSASIPTAEAVEATP